MTDDISGYRFEDLQAARRIVESRTDLSRKQKKLLGFPKPVKLSGRQTWFPKAEVQEWLRQRIAMRDNPGDAGKTHPPKGRAS